MGRHDADPADRRRYTGAVVLFVLVVALLVVGVLALRALSHG
jgi:predicted nucleic acid-binding Zn ribbon protein